MDPDYALSETVREEANKRREKEKCEQIEKARARIHEDFQREFQRHEDQLIEFQNRITCLAKTLHVLRYVLVTNYYNKQEAQMQLSAEDLKQVDVQAKLHPAVKKLTQDLDLSIFDFSKRKTRRSLKQSQVMSINLNQTVENTPVKAEPLIATDTSLKIATPSDDCATIPRNRQMAKKRVIMGNISKFMPSDNSDDKSTHKWMVYIRGPQEYPRIDDFIEKIIFHLHPSYKPHDVVDISEHPFHLTRRGWGEFPIRCQLVFKNPLNKPVDVIHHLKLDKTYSGRQTLGSETILQLTIYDENATHDILDNDAEHQTTASEQLDPVLHSNEECNREIAKQLLVDEFSHSVVASKEILDPNYMDVENIEIFDEALAEIKTESDNYGDYYYQQCPALSDHTYSRAVRSN